MSRGSLLITGLCYFLMKEMLSAMDHCFKILSLTTPGVKKRNNLRRILSISEVSSGPRDVFLKALAILLGYRRVSQNLNQLSRSTSTSNELRYSQSDACLPHSIIVDYI